MKTRGLSLTISQWRTVLSNRTRVWIHLSQVTKTPHPCTPSSLDFSPSPNYTEKAGTGMNVMKKLTFGGFRGFSRDLIKGWVGVPTWLNVPTAHKRSLTPKPPPLPSPASAPTLPVLALTQAPSQTHWISLNFNNFFHTIHVRYCLKSTGLLNLKWMESMIFIPFGS